MGFMGIKNYTESDGAANFQYKLYRDINRQFRLELKNEANEYNTPGWLNALLIFKTFPSFIHFAETSVIEQIKKRIDKDTKENGYLWHAGGKALVTNFKQLLKERGKV